MRKIEITEVVGAGVMLVAIAAAIAGVYELSDPQPIATATPRGSIELNAKPDTVPDAGRSIYETEPSPARSDQQELQLAELARLRAWRDEQRHAKSRDIRCIGGTAFEVKGDAWANVGRC